MAKASIKLSDEQIEAKKDAFLSDIAKKSELAKQGRSTPTQIFLNKIKDVITVAIESNLSYKEIAKSIYSQWNVKVSDQTIKRFAENTLGIKKERAQKQTVKESVKAEIKTAAPVAPAIKSNDGAKVLQTDGVKKAPANFDDI